MRRRNSWAWEIQSPSRDAPVDAPSARLASIIARSSCRTDYATYTLCVCYLESTLWIVSCLFMDSSTHKSREQDAKQADIRAKIAALQAQLETGDISDAPPPEPRDKGKRKAEPPSDVLAPSTPSPSTPAFPISTLSANNVPEKRIKRDVTQKPLHASSISSRALQPTRPLPNPASRPSASNSTLASKPPPAPSGLVHKLAALSKPSARPAAPTRSAAFAEPAPFPDILPVPNRTHQDATPDDHGRCQVQRDDNLALIETLEPEPTCEHKPPLGDPDFRTLEPHSGIRLA